MLTIEGYRVRVDTRRLVAVLDRGRLVSVVRKSDGRELIHSSADGKAPLQLVYSGEETVPLGGASGDRVTCIPVNDYRAEIRFETWNGDGILSISEDIETGDLIVEPSAYASRPGLRACRWVLAGIDRELELVAPFYQGIRLPLEDPLIRDSRWHWPRSWEAGLAILQGAKGGMWVHCQDNRYRYKALKVGTAEQPRCLGLDTEVYGPLDDRLSAGDLAWRLNVYEGDWRVPATRYRDWLSRAYRLDHPARPDWLKELRLALSWCPTEPGILDALAKRLPPGHVLLHVPGWRRDPYDENYPTFTPSEAGQAFIQKAQAMGFRTMPHFNSIDMDPSNPVYPRVRDFQYRALETKRVQGWTYVDGQVKPVPESNATRLRHRDKKTMVKIHPGLSMWRSILTERVRSAAETLSLQAVFLDVTLCTWNLHNCLVDNITPTEGMKRLIAQVASLGTGLVVGGEGRNEITMQDQFFGQTHLFKSGHASIQGLERTGGCPLSEFLFGQWCRSFGYARLSGRTPDEQTRIRLHTSLGAIPTLTVRSAAELEQPNMTVKEVLKHPV